MRNTLTKLFLILALLPLSVVAGQADDRTRLETKKIDSRFGADQALAKAYEKGSGVEIDPLSLYARTVWPADVKTVADAVQYLLEPTGYQLAVVYPAPASAMRLVQKPLPPIAKVHRTMPIIDALQLLVGLDNWIIVDRTNGLISFSEKKL